MSLLPGQGSHSPGSLPTRRPSLTATELAPSTTAGLQRDSPNPERCRGFGPHEAQRLVGETARCCSDHVISGVCASIIMRVSCSPRLEIRSMSPSGILEKLVG